MSFGATLAPRRSPDAQIRRFMISAAREGAPTHHEERALLTVMLLLAVFAGDVLVHLVALPRARAAVTVAAALCAAGIAGVLFRSRPDAESASVDRGGEVAVGEAAAGMVTPGNRLLVEVVDYGYLAIVAGFGRPEDAVVDRDIDPRHVQTTSSFDDAATLKTRLGAADARAFVARRSAIASALGDEREARGGVWGVFVRKTDAIERPPLKKAWGAPGSRRAQHRLESPALPEDSRDMDARPWWIWRRAIQTKKPSSTRRSPVSSEEQGDDPSSDRKSRPSSENVPTTSA